MKRQLLSLMMLLAALAGWAQTDYSVGTSIEKRKALLEEFTGQACYWCTEGHQLARQMLQAMPGDAFVVAVHTGHYSGEYGGINLQTEMSNALGDYFKSDQAGYPCGMVNRTDFYGTGSYPVGRSYWLPIAQRLHEQDATVNLWQRAVYDGATNTLTVRVEGYFTAADQPADQHLNVVITQSNIIGYQNGGGNDYSHQHVLRANLTPTWGEELDEPQQGQYFVREYQYTVPTEPIGGVVMVPEQIEVISFVTSGKADVLNVCGGRPEYQNYGQQPGATLTAPRMPIGNRYGYNFFELTLNNTSAIEIESATFDVTVNGETTTATVDCEVGQYASAEIAIPATYGYAAKGKTKFEICLKELNGEPVEEQTYGGSFSQPKVVTATIDLKMMTDNSPEQNRWLLKDADGTLIREFGPYEGRGTTIEETITLEGGQTYCMEVTDAIGNGLLNGVKGGLILHDGTGTLIDQFYQINDWGTRSFFTIDNESSGIADATLGHDTATGKKPQYTDLTGRTVSGTGQKGVTIMRESGRVRKVINK